MECRLLIGPYWGNSPSKRIGNFDRVQEPHCSFRKIAVLEIPVLVTNHVTIPEIERSGTFYRACQYFIVCGSVHLV